MKRWMLRWVWTAPLLAALGCGEARPGSTTERVTPPSAAPTLFDPATAGSIRGQVVWKGDLPSVPPFEIRSLVSATNPPQPRLIRENPNAPLVDPESRGVLQAVVFLRKVDPRQARPWDHPPVTVEHADRRLIVTQGEVKSHVGFLRPGNPFTMVSHDKTFNSLHADGAAYFTLPLPDPERPLTRAFKEPGVVELSSAAGYYWMRCYLFVADHPYFVRTDSQGRFKLDQVPPGRYEIVCWLPNWNKRSEDRDPESDLVTRVFFQPPLEVVREIVVNATGEANVEFKIESSMFVH